MSNAAQGSDNPVEVTPVPALEVIENELARRDQAMVTRIASIESKAGLHLGFAAVVIAQVYESHTWAARCALIIALVSSVGALVALWPRRAKEISVSKLRDKYMGGSVEAARRAVLDSRIPLLSQREETFGFKVKAYRCSAVLLLVSAAFLVVGNYI
jgi:hypothetical protein